jgi:hypothetical protein
MRLGITAMKERNDRIQQCVEQIITDPYTQTEFLDDVSGKLNLKGCRSITRLSSFLRRKNFCRMRRMSADFRL